MTQQTLESWLMNVQGKINQLYSLDIPPDERDAEIQHAKRLYLHTTKRLDAWYKGIEAFRVYSDRGRMYVQDMKRSGEELQIHLNLLQEAMLFQEKQVYISDN
jgi:hypothetical protein